MVILGNPYVGGIIDNEQVSRVRSNEQGGTEGEARGAPRAAGGHRGDLRVQPHEHLRAPVKRRGGRARG